MSSDEAGYTENPSPLVLIANDQEWTARAVESILVAAGFRVLRTHTARETLDVAASMNPDVVILDHQLPDYSGVEVCRRLRSDPRFGPGLPVIITTAGPSGRPQRLAAYDAGAWEFYGQPLDAEALLHKLRNYCASYRALRRSREDALIDITTGLYSRSGLVRRAGELIGEARRAGRSVACVRWSFAEPVTPDVLDRAAATFRVQGRNADAHGRLASGEFATVAPDTGAVGADCLAQRFRDLLARAGGVTADAIRTTIIVLEDKGALAADGEALVERLSGALAA